MSLKTRKPQRSRNRAAIAAIASGERTSPQESRARSPRPRESTRWGSLRIDRMIGGVAVKQIRGELDRVAHRAADQLAEPTAGRAAAGVEAGQLDPRVAATCPALAARGRICGRQRRSGRSRASVARSSAVVTFSPPWVSPMPTIPPSVRNSTTLRRKYGPWQPLAASSGGSGSAIGVTFKPVIVNGGLRRSDRECPTVASTAASQDATGHEPQRVATMWSRSIRGFSSDSTRSDRIGSTITAAARPDRCRAWHPAS